jgi:hypothetical protein
MAVPSVNDWIHRAEKPHSRDASYLWLRATATKAAATHAGPLPIEQKIGKR